MVCALIRTGQGSGIAAARMRVGPERLVRDVELALRPVDEPADLVRVQNIAGPAPVQRDDVVRTHVAEEAVAVSPPGDLLGARRSEPQFAIDQH